MIQYEDEMMMTMNIWGRDFEIEISMDVFEGEIITDNQKETLDKFLKLQSDIFMQAYDKIKEFCLDNYADRVNKDNFNIFSYVIPQSLYVPRSEEGKRVVGIFCKFRFDQENDLVAYIENEHCIKIGSQDIIL